MAEAIDEKEANLRHIHPVYCPKYWRIGMSTYLSGLIVTDKL